MGLCRRGGAGAEHVFGEPPPPGFAARKNQHESRKGTRAPPQRRRGQSDEDPVLVPQAPPKENEIIPRNEVPVRATRRRLTALLRATRPGCRFECLCQRRESA